MNISGDCQDRQDMQGLNRWLAEHEQPRWHGTVILDSSLPPHGFSTDRHKLYVGQDAHRRVRMFLAGRGIELGTSLTAEGAMAL